MPSRCAFPRGGVDVYVFAGPTMMDAVRRFNLFDGGGALPPKWGLGFMTRTPLAYTAAQVLDEIAAFRRRGIPLDMIGLEPGWHDHAYPTSFEWDRTRFPDPADFLAKLEALHVRANLWFNPYVSPTAPLYREAAAVCRFASGLERHRARLFAAGRTSGLRRSLAIKIIGLTPARAGRIQDR